MNRDEALAILERAQPVCTPEAARAAVDRLAREITGRLSGEFPVVLAVMGGAVVFAGQLLPLLAFPLQFAAIEVTRYANTTAGGGIEWRLAPRDEVRGRTVLVLDDILDEGVTLAAIRERLLGMGAREVLTAVFADKETGRAKPVAADFVGVRVPDRYVFGFGMDAYGLWRNLPGVHALGGG
ncbi:MAG: hypoxanthine-guanine phosphoribosyltransferase [Burkholderiales bacterium]|nr:hypoxanthine-guanine phosphoribosyltransferase [Burkholderiales bacterium]